ncbi:MAG: arsenate reductase ArsC [Acholeplasmataceae bacterium]|nr:arsenate reductase ArsC [Acholeplasmataceae bacterium]
MLKVGFVCVHNSLRSQIAEAMFNHYGKSIAEAYSAGTETKNQINPDAVRILKAYKGIDMSRQKSKLIDTLPKLDIRLTMGCEVECPTVFARFYDVWDLEDPTGQPDSAFIKTIDLIETKILKLIKEIKAGKYN